MNMSIGKTVALIAVVACFAATECEAEITECCLDNGLRVTLRPVAGATDVAVVVLYDVGELHDPPGKSGLGHLVEHIYVTAATPTTPQRTADQFMKSYGKEMFGRVAYQCNAQTGDDFTVVASVVPADRFDEEIKQTAERLGKLRIEQSDLDREVPRMLAETHNMFEDVPQLAVRNHARERLHPRPNGGRHGGVAEQIKRITLSDVRQHWQNYYKACNARLVIAGNIDAKKVEETVRRIFGDVPTGQPVPAKPADLPPIFGRTKVPAAKNASGSLVCIAYCCPPPDSKLYPAFLALVARLQVDATKKAANPTEFPVIFAPVDDGTTLYVTSKAKQDETTDQAIARWSKFVADTVGAVDVKNAGLMGRQQFAFLLGTMELPDAALNNNLYGVAFSLARRNQLGIVGTQIGNDLNHLQQDAIDQCVKENFGEDDRAVAIIEP
jgi:zinc protease